MIAHTWHGRSGAVILGPTEARVARYLHHATRHGRVTLRTMDLAAALGLERSEAYRITRRLRILGLFGIENDKGGTKGGRRFWRTPTEHAGAKLDDARHRSAWGRVVAWARALTARARARLLIRQDGAAKGARVGLSTPVGSTDARALDGPTGVNFADMMRSAGLGPLMDEWGV